MPKIHVAFVVTNCKKTGPINQTMNIIRFMDQEKFEASLITVLPEEQGNSILDMYRDLGITIYPINISKKQSILLGRRKVENTLYKIKPDVVHSVGIPPYRWTLGYKDAIHFVTLRNYCYEDYPDQYGKMIGPFMAEMDMHLIRKRIRMGEPFVTCSKSLTEMYRERQNIDIPFIRNGVDISKYKKRDLMKARSLRKKLRLPMDKTVFVYSGRLIDRKNQEEAIRAFLKMRNLDRCILAVLGDGPNRDKLKEMSSERPNVLFFGEVGNVSEFLQASDIYVATSKSEGLPNGVLEAMATALPVLLSNIPQHMEVLEPEPGCGHSYELGNVNQLTEKMDEMVDEPLAEMGEKSYQAVKRNFTAKVMSQNYQALYKNLMEK